MSSARRPPSRSRIPAGWTTTRSGNDVAEAVFGGDRPGSQKPTLAGASGGGGGGARAIMARTGKSKTGVWRWQERFCHEGVDGLLHDKSRPPGIAPIAEGRVAEIVRLPRPTAASIRDLQAALNRFVAGRNADDPEPFTWRAEAEAIAARNRGFQTVESIRLSCSDPEHARGHKTRSVSPAIIAEVSKERCHGGAGVVPVRIIEEPTRQCRAPVTQNFDQLTTFDVWVHVFLKHVSNPLSGEGCLQFLMRGAESDPPLRNYLHHLAVFRELPFGQRSAGKASTNAPMTDEVLRRQGRSGMFEVSRRGRECVAKRRPQWNGDHILLDLPSKPHARIETLFYHIDDRSVADEFDTDFGIVLHEVENDRT